MSHGDEMRPRANGPRWNSQGHSALESIAAAKFHRAPAGRRFNAHHSAPLGLGEKMVRARAPNQARWTWLLGTVLAKRHSPRIARGSR